MKFLANTSSKSECAHVLIEQLKQSCRGQAVIVDVKKLLSSLRENSCGARNPQPSVRGLGTCLAVIEVPLFHLHMGQCSVFCVLHSMRASYLISFRR